MGAENKQLRLDFSDYPAVAQEKDLARKAEANKKDVYIMKVNGVWGAFLPKPHYSFSITGELGQEMTKFITDVKEILVSQFNINPRFRCILNKGVEDHIRQQLIIHKLLDSGASK